jgi:hypothetical protein
MLEFAGYRNGGTDQLTVEQRYPGLSGYAIYLGQALKLSGGYLCGAEVTADLIYAISDISAASSVVTASYYPRVFPVNSNQIWKSSAISAMTAAVAVLGTGIGLSTACATGFCGDTLGTAAVVFQIATGGTPASGGSPASAIWGVFQSLAIK